MLCFFLCIFCAVIHWPASLVLISALEMSLAQSSLLGMLLAAILLASVVAAMFDAVAVLVC